MEGIPSMNFLGISSFSCSHFGIPIPSLPPFIRIVIMQNFLKLKNNIMTTFEKHYIGKGTQVENLDIIKIVLPVEGLEKAVFEKNGVKYISFEVAKLRGEDKFGRTHTCYYQTKVTSAIPTQDEPAEKQEKASKKKSKKEMAPEDDLPF
jgi:hypothetical protein